MNVYVIKYEVSKSVRNNLEQVEITLLGEAFSRAGRVFRVNELSLLVHG